MTEQETSWITLVDEEGHEHKFNLLNVVEMEGNKYAIMVPELQEDEDEEEAVVFKIETDEDGEEILVDIEDDEEFARVCAMLDELDMEDEELEEEDDPDQK